MELVAETVKDADGAPAQPYRAVDTIETLLRRGTITREMAAAADTFRRAFRIAHMDPLRAADMGRVPNAHAKPVDPPAWARSAVTGAIERLGGQGSIAASCIWAVVGLEVPISRWSVEHAGLTRQVGSGVLLAALGILAFHFSGWRSAA